MLHIHAAMTYQCRTLRASGIEVKLISVRIDGPVDQAEAAPLRDPAMLNLIPDDREHRFLQASCSRFDNSSSLSVNWPCVLRMLDSSFSWSRRVVRIFGQAMASATHQVTLAYH